MLHKTHVGEYNSFRVSHKTNSQIPETSQLLLNSNQFQSAMITAKISTSDPKNAQIKYDDQSVATG